MKKRGQPIEGGELREKGGGDEGRNEDAGRE